DDRHLRMLARVRARHGESSTGLALIRDQRSEVSAPETARLQLTSILLNRFHGCGGRRSSQNCGVSAVALADRCSGERVGPLFCFFDSDFAGTTCDDSWDYLSSGWPFAGVARVIHHARGWDPCQSRQTSATDRAGWALPVHSQPDVSGPLSGAGRDRVFAE